MAKANKKSKRLVIDDAREALLEIPPGKLRDFLSTKTGHIASQWMAQAKLSPLLEEAFVALVGRKFLSSGTQKSLRQILITLCEQASECRRLKKVLRAHPDQALALDEAEGRSVCLRLLSASGTRKANRHRGRGYISTEYDWLADTHKSPNLREALGVSHNAMLGMLSRLNIKARRAKVANRAGEITMRDALRLLEARLSSSHNRDPRAAQDMQAFYVSGQQVRPGLQRLKELLVRCGASPAVAG